MTFSAFFVEHIFSFTLLFLALGALLKIELDRARQRTPKISILGLSQALEAGAILIDIRPRDAYKKGHIAQALSQPADQLNQIKQDKEALLIVYDEDGLRTDAWAVQLKQAGFTRVMILDGGLNAWLGENYPVVKA